jgi:hypothetical protein
MARNRRSRPRAFGVCEKQSAQKGAHSHVRQASAAKPEMDLAIRFDFRAELGKMAPKIAEGAKSIYTARTASAP